MVPDGQESVTDGRTQPNLYQFDFIGGQSQGGVL